MPDAPVAGPSMRTPRRSSRRGAAKEEMGEGASGSDDAHSMNFDRSDGWSRTGPGMATVVATAVATGGEGQGRAKERARQVHCRADAASAHRRPEYSSSGCVPAGPDSASPSGRNLPPKRLKVERRDGCLSSVLGPPRIFTSAGEVRSRPRLRSGAEGGAKRRPEGTKAPTAPDGRCPGRPK